MHLYVARASKAPWFCEMEAETRAHENAPQWSFESLYMGPEIYTCRWVRMRHPLWVTYHSAGTYCRTRASKIRLFVVEPALHPQSAGNTARHQIQAWRGAPWSLSEFSFQTEKATLETKQLKVKRFKSLLELMKHFWIINAISRSSASKDFKHLSLFRRYTQNSPANCGSLAPHPKFVETIFVWWAKLKLSFEKQKMLYELSTL